MPRRRIGQETFGFEARDTVTALDELRDLIDWSPIEAALEALPAARRGEAGWPPTALFRALLIAVWHDLSDVKLADALDDRASFRRFCGFSRFASRPSPTTSGAASASCERRERIRCRRADQPIRRQ